LIQSVVFGGLSLVTSTGGICLLNQCPYQTQQFLMLGASATCAKEGANFDLAASPARSQVGLVLDEHVTGVGITGKPPPIAIGTLVKGSYFDTHAYSPLYLEGLEGTDRRAG
jgi:hypothetical protein